MNKEIMDQIDSKDIQEQSSSSKTLLTGIIIFAGIILLGLIFMPKPGKTYKISEEQMLTQLVARQNIATPELIVDLIYNPDSFYQFIDLRSAPEFIKGHLPKAINIPVNHIFDKEYEPILADKSKTNILYASDHALACGPWMILNQLGLKNNLIMLGGYDYVNQYIIDKFAPMSGNFRDEKAKFDFAKIIGQTGGNQSTLSATEKSAKTPVLKKKKEAKSSGGC
jgi:rhodanese-related sulfurtransferase